MVSRDEIAKCFARPVFWPLQRQTTHVYEKQSLLYGRVLVEKLWLVSAAVVDFVKYPTADPVSLGVRLIGISPVIGLALRNVTPGAG